MYSVHDQKQQTLQRPAQSEMWVAVWQNMNLGYEMINIISNEHGGLTNMI